MKACAISPKRGAVKVRCQHSFLKSKLPHPSFPAGYYALLGRNRGCCGSAARVACAGCVA
jgi:hypothetical protein